MVIANADMLTQREALAGLLADPRDRHGLLITTVRRVYRSRVPHLHAPRARGQRGLGVPRRQRPHRQFLGVLKVAPGDRAAVATWPAGCRARRRPAAGGLAGGAASRRPRAGGSAAPPGARARATRTTAAASRPTRRSTRRTRSGRRGGRRRARRRGRGRAGARAAAARRMRRRCCCPDWCAPRFRSAAAPAAPVLDAAALRRGHRPGGRADRGVRRGPRAAGLRRQGERRLLHDLLRLPYSKYMARWAARRGWTPNGVTRSRSRSASSPPPVRDRRARGDDRRRGPAPARVHARLRRRPARALHAHLHQARRLARLDLRPHEGVRRLRGPGDRRVADGRRRVAARRRGADPAGDAPLDRLLLPAGPAPGDGRRSASRRSSRWPTGSAPPSRWPLVPRASRSRQAPAPPPPRPEPGQRLRGGWRALDRSSRAVWVKKIIGFPIGERFAAISLTAALFDARTTFIVLLAWGGFAAAYSAAGRVLRSLGRRGSVALDRGAPARPARSTPTATTGRSRSRWAGCRAPPRPPPRSCWPASRRCSR